MLKSSVFFFSSDVTSSKLGLHARWTAGVFCARLMGANKRFGIDVRARGRSAGRLYHSIGHVFESADFGRHGPEVLVRRDSESVVDFFTALALSSPISLNVRPGASRQTLQHSESSGSRVRFLSMGTRCKVQFGPSQLSVKAGLSRESSRWRLGAERTRQQNLEEAGLLLLAKVANLSEMLKEIHQH